MKEFIQKNKEQFDSEKPNRNLWEAIEQELPQEHQVRMVPIRRIYQVIMGMTAVFVFGLLTFQYQLSGEEVLSNTVQNPDQISSVQQLESYYSLQVNQRMSLLSEYEVDEELLAEVDFLKVEFERLKSEADNGVNQKEILDEMIDNYRLRVSILEEIMKEVSKHSNEGNYVVQ